MNAQGEDVVAGIRTPETLSALEKADPEMYKQLVGFKDKLENHYSDMQDIEFTIQEEVLYILQTRNAKRTGPAAVRCAVEMVGEGSITKETAINRVTPDQLDQLLHPMIDPKTKKTLELLAKGLNASPGAACGQVVFTADEAEKWVKDGKKVLLVRRDTSPEDIGGMVVAEGILTSTGGMTSHAAVVARGMGTPCVAGCKELDIHKHVLKVKGLKIKEGDWLTIDGSTGEVFNGAVPLAKAEFDERLITFLSWADKIRLGAERKGLPKGFFVRTNADQPHDAKVAREFGAEGIGLCRTEHMFFEGEKLEIFQEMIVAKDLAKRKEVVARLLPLQKEDFAGIFKAMDGLPVTVRLLDPPLHEFVPHTHEDIKSLAKKMSISVEDLQSKIDSLHELNPMLGHRGCRLGITYPEVYDMQVEAIMTAACEQSAKGIKVIPEIMIPLVGTYVELKMLRENAEKVIASVFEKLGTKIDHKIGTMIEIPRAAITADEVAKHADFFSFGTNDLTQMTFGYSRDDIGGFLPDYLGKGVLESDPFQTIDQNGVGVLVKMATDKSRALKPDMKLGICGEHGGEGASIDFCYRTGLNYVSCSPYRVPLARLSAAQAVLNNK
jgi:pyruvate,orthophosphate dikinase